jgi:hypothetical protein
MKTLKLTCLLVIGIVLTTNAQIDVKKITETPKPEAFFSDSKMKVISGDNNIVIPELSICFVVRSSLSVTKGKGDDKATASSVLTLSGIDNATLQQITDDVYDFYIDEIKKTGLNVIPYDDFTKSQKFGDLGIEKQPLGVEFKFSGLWDVLSKISGATHAKKFTAHNRPDFYDMIAAPSNNFMKIWKIAKEMNAVINEVNITVEFVEYDSKKGLAWKANVNALGGREMANSVSLKCIPNVFPSTYLANFITAKGMNGTTRSSDWCSYGGEFFKEMNTTKTGSAFMEEYGGKSFRFYDVVANPDQYKEQAEKILKDYMRMQVQIIQANLKK